MGDGISELDAARHTAHRWLSFAENARADSERADTIVLRYEDMAREPGPSAARLSTFLSLRLVPAEAPNEFLNSHRTTSDVSASVGRWQREPLSDVVRICLETQLRDLMVDYGYKVSDDAQGQSEIPRNPERAFNGTIHVVESTMVISVGTEDFNMELQPTPLRALSTDEIWTCVQGDTGDHCSVYWRGRREAFSEERCVTSHSGQAVTGRSCGFRLASTRCGGMSSTSFASIFSTATLRLPQAGAFGGSDT